MSGPRPWWISLVTIRGQRGRRFLEESDRHCYFWRRLFSPVLLRPASPAAIVAPGVTLCAGLTCLPSAGDEMERFDMQRADSSWITGDEEPSRAHGMENWGRYIRTAHRAVNPPGPRLTNDIPSICVYMDLARGRTLYKHGIRRVCKWPSWPSITCKFNKSCMKFIVFMSQLNVTASL